MKTTKDLMRGGDIWSAGRQEKVLDVIRSMADRKVGAVPVIDRGRLVGMFSERDLMTKIVCKGLDPASVAIEDVMTTTVVTAHPAESVRDCLAKMQAIGCRHIPIVAGEKMVGMLSLRDLLAILLQDTEGRLALLELYAWGKDVSGSELFLVWRCSACNHEVRSEEAPAKCPGCGVPANKFALAAAEERV